MTLLGRSWEGADEQTGGMGKMKKGQEEGKASRGHWLGVAS